MRAAAQIDEPVVPIEADHLSIVLGQFAHDLDLERLTVLVELRQRGIPGQLTALEGDVRSHLFAHLGLDRLEIGRG